MNQGMDGFVDATRGILLDVLSLGCGMAGLSLAGATVVPDCRVGPVGIVHTWYQAECSLLWARFEGHKTGLGPHQSAG